MVIRIMLCALIFGVLMMTPGHAALIIPCADGSDGVFNPTSNVEIDLGQAANAEWGTTSPIPGKGVYDGEKWAVVFKYSEVNIPAGVTVTFKNHFPNAPVVWLVSGNVTINGTVSVNSSSNWAPGTFVAGGPGGFRGGASSVGATLGTDGFGPGAGVNGADGSFGGLAINNPGGHGPVGPTYGNPQLLPLIGGSGSSAYQSLAGGPGGGAILLACANTISVNGLISASSVPGAGFFGSGGAIRIIADTYQVSGSLRAIAGHTNAGDGRIRIEAAHGSVTGSISPQPSYGASSNPAQIWPESTAPSIKVTQIAGLSVPSDPKAGFDFPNQDVMISAEQAVAVRVEASNVPLDWLVKVRVGPLNNSASWVSATLVCGDATASVWEAQVTLPKGFTAIQARASKP